MEHETVAVQPVKAIPTNERRWLENVVGRQLEENQQVFIMVFTPGREPAEELRRKARAALEDTFRKTDAYAQEHGITDAEIELAIQEALDHIRSETK